MAVICDNAAARAFHVHTYRCRHAENVPDDAYVVKAMELGASEIWFTDHCPFPGDPFGNRMGWDELGEYVSTLRGLRDRYPDIDIHIGLEAEYFPTYDEQGLYTMLTKDMGIEYLLLGQHMAQIGSDPPAYSFSLDKDELIRREYRLLGGATVQGIESGRFSAVAHPDWIYRQCTDWTEDMATAASEIISAADRAHMPLELDLSSMECGMYRQEFWDMVPTHMERITGLDAHSVSELEERYNTISSSMYRRSLRPKAVYDGFQAYFSSIHRSESSISSCISCPLPLVPCPLSLVPGNGVSSCDALLRKRSESGVVSFVLFAFIFGKTYKDTKETMIC